MVSKSPSQAPGAVRSVIGNALYRGSLILLVNTVAVSAIGLVFWTLAAHAYRAPAVGVFSSVISGVGLLAAIAALGLQNTLIRHISSADDPRSLVVGAVTAIATVGTALCLLTVLLLASYYPRVLHLRQRGPMLFLVIALVVFTAVSSTLDAGLIAKRASHVVLIKNVIGSIAKVVALYLLVSYRSSGLLISYSLGLVLATIISGVALGRRLGGPRVGFRSFLLPRHYLSITSGNYLATIMGILPVSVVPIEVLVVLGAAQTARFAVAFLIAGFLNVIPSTVAQVLFAEASREGVALGRLLRNAIRGIYGLLLPAVAIVVLIAPFVLQVFGAAYALAATGCLRVLALSALLTGGTYLVDSVLIARDRIGAYVFINGANAALVLGCVRILLPRGLTAAACGWALAQGLSLVIGLLLIARGAVGRHHSRTVPALTEAGQQATALESDRNLVASDLEPQIRALLEARPAMPTTLIAEYIGWDQSIGILLERVRELLMAHPYPYSQMSRANYPPGEIALCGLWFPPVELRVGSGQVRSTRQLPVLTMITGYSRWLSATLIPSRHVEDLLAGLWQLLASFGAVPHVLAWDSEIVAGYGESDREELIGKCKAFSKRLGVDFLLAEAHQQEIRELIDLTHLSLEHGFLSGRTFMSPMDFDMQLLDWLAAVNARARRRPSYAPAELLAADRQAMLELPPEPPRTGWRFWTRVGRPPLILFDSNAYSVHPALIGRKVEVVADLSRVRVLCDGRVAADHERAWTYRKVFNDQAHF